MWRHELSSESHGFTLVELLLALALVSLLTMALTSFVLAWQRQTYADYLRASLQDDLQYTQEILTFHLRRAYDIETSGSTFEITVAEGKQKFGHNAGQKTIWLHRASHPICSYIEQLEVDISQKPLVRLRITTSSQIPGIEQGLPLILEWEVCMRNYMRSAKGMMTWLGENGTKSVGGWTWAAKPSS